MNHEEEALRWMRAAAGVIVDTPKGAKEGAVRGGEYTTRLAHVEATLYVGAQLERIADLLTGGYRVSRHGDTFGDEARYVEPMVGS